jgi:hypothetical protein
VSGPGGLDPLADPGRVAPGALRIDRDGLWLHEGQPVTHPGVQANLYANLQRDPQGGYHLAVGPVRLPVAVDDTPYVVSRVEREAGQVVGHEALSLHLSDGSVEVLDPATLWLDGAGVPRCLVKAGRFPARLSVAAWLQLAPFVEQAPGEGPLTLVLGPRRVPLGGGPPG